MTKKYICPKHKDTNPSAHAYSDHYFCFVCHARGPLNELGLEPGERIEITYVEDVQATISYIDRLPRKAVRGFTLPLGPRGYYIVWPSRDYYKLRIEGAESGSKYRGPSGHSKPPFVASPSVGVLQRDSRDRLVLVEGELNALSLATLEPPFDIVSPGGAGDFYSKGNEQYLREYSRYSRVDVVVDDDPAGGVAAIETKVKLITLGCPEVKIHLIDTDFNALLCGPGGKEALREEARRMDLF